MTDFSSWTAQIQQRTENVLAALLPAADVAPQRLHNAMRYAILGGGKRVRPLLMTTATTVFGLLPIFLTHGRGSDVMQPMAIPMIGGMAVQVITFLLAPCLYALVMERKVRQAAARR